jgi:toxin-antitoxin system PIN domain toxin
LRAFVDTNIFVYATYPSFPHYSRARDFLESCLEGSDLWYLSWSVVYEYLKVVTDAKLFLNEVLPLSLAIDNVLKFLSSPYVEIIQETAEHAHYLGGLAKESQPITGGVLHDAHIVALMREHDLSKIYTADTDFHRFQGIEAVNPLR